MALGVSDYAAILVFISSTGRPSVLSRGPWAEKVLGGISYFLRFVFVFKMFPSLGAKKILLAGHLAVLEPTCPFSGPNLAPKTEEKSMVLGVQEPTYVARAENVKIGTTLKRKPCFCFPGASEKPSKIDEKLILRAFYVAIFFQHPKNRSLSSPEALLDNLLTKTQNFDPKNSPQKLFHSGGGGLLRALQDAT